MKNSYKKKIAVIAAIVAVLALISAGTLAWFNDKDTAINKFAVSSEEGDFKVTVNETSGKLDDSPNAITGTPYTSEDGKKGIDFTGGNTKLIPGSVVSKKAFVTNDSKLKVDEWVRVLVTIEHAPAWKTICEKYGITDLTKIFGGHDETYWERLNSGSDLAYYVYENPSADTLTYAFYYKDKLAQGTSTMPIFDRITIPGELTAEELKSIADENGAFDVKVEAQAVQATNNDAKTAVEAFKNVGWTINGTPAK